MYVWLSCESTVLDAVSLCTLQDLIQEPVIAADGITYERAAIAKWLSRRKVSYVTKAFMRPELVPNRNVQAIIDKLANA